MMQDTLPVAVIGAGPVGLAAAAHVIARGERPLIFEAGTSAGASVLAWSHVRMFSPWRYNVDPASAQLLAAAGWERPPDEAYPTGHDLVERYVAPLARHASIAPHVRYDARVRLVSRLGLDRTKTATRERTPFILRVLEAGRERDIVAKAVIDASGTWGQPNPLGAHGLPAIGEQDARPHVDYGIPDVLGRHRDRYAGQRVLIVGSGHSAMNVLLDLARLAEDALETRMQWAVRRPALDGVFGGGDRDQLPERGRLGVRLRELVDAGRLNVVTGFALSSLAITDRGLIASDGHRALEPVDRIVGATGFRPDLDLLRELRVDLDTIVESPRALAPLIDPNVHSCGTVPPHGAVELQHPERDVYIIGMKSYGRAPTFLLRTGYEQARSVAAAIAGDWDSARRGELTLPETGVCSVPGDEAGISSACCGTASTASAASIASADVVPVSFVRSRPR